MALSSILNIGAQSLAAYQSALSVTSHNISNADNTNYSRERVLLKAQTTTSAAGTIGAGVTMEDVSRVRDSIVDSQLRQYYSQNSMSTKTSDFLSQVESTLSEPGDSGLSTMINNFFDSWSKLSVTPDSSSLRQNVLQTGQLMTQKMQSIYQGIQQVYPDLENEASSTVDTVNTTLQSIQTLNKQIYEAQLTGSDTNDLLDSRDAAIDSLSKLANINVSYDKDNSANISIGGVLAADRYSSMQFHTTVDNGQLKMQTSDNATTVNLTGGELGSIVQLHNTTLPSYLKQLDDTANKIMTQVNTLHASGTTLTTPPKTGVNFFSSYSNGVLTINPDIVSNTNNIAASADGSTGNNEIAKSIADAGSAKLSDGTTITSTYAAFVNKVGTDVQQASQSTDSTGSVVQQLEGQRSNYSGVSVDEEMTNIMKYQRSYEASAKVVNMANEIMQTLLTMVS